MNPASTYDLSNLHAPRRIIQKISIRKRGSRLSFLLLLFLGCIEPYEFVVKDQQKTLVVEGQISNVSALEHLGYPADARYFSIKLSRTGDVTNQHGSVVGNAVVYLVDDLGAVWNYSEVPFGSGSYLLLDANFHAEAARSYQLHIELDNDKSYRSDWVHVPGPFDIPVGDISFEEIVKQDYRYVLGDRVIREFDGINVFVNLPSIPSVDPIYYRWTFAPTYIFDATIPGVLSPIHRCWVNEPTYLSDFTLHKDKVGGYRKKLLFMETTDNWRVYHDFSLLVTQYVLSKDFYDFWKQLQEQSSRGGLHDTQPSNLPSNIHGQDPDDRVSGFFGVVGETGRRWYINKGDLSYPIVDYVQAYCKDPLVLEKDSSCYSCLEYRFGTPSNVKPSWWH